MADTSAANKIESLEQELKQSKDDYFRIHQENCRLSSTISELERQNRKLLDIVENLSTSINRISK